MASEQHNGSAGDIDLRSLLTDVFDADWYAARYPDVIAAKLSPLVHFLDHGVTEWREPNPFFTFEWYAEHYPDVSARGVNPLVHYLMSGAAELRNPHPRFDAAWYVEQHPEAAANPMLFHMRIGATRGYLTEQPVNLADYLPATPLPRPTTRPRRPLVDVVIPVYRGLEETQRCLESVLANTSGPLGRILVIEDRSPEPDLVAWLTKQAALGRIQLLRNRRNLGFVRSVNAGMAAAGQHDVVLLNSDTEVPPGWLERLADQAYADKKIASVSPFSNNATICGYPDNDGGPIPFGLSVDSVDAACRQVNAGRFIDVPTTVGFCMYIRRAALDKVGRFDAETFGLGYGEENDFCLRASAMGWRHRLACDVFVYHKGSVSFGDKARALMQRATETLAERFPDYAGSVARHVGRGEVNPFRFALTAEIFRRSGLPVILMVSHGLGGGVRQHINTLVTRLAGRAHVLLLEGTDRGATLSVPALENHPVLAMPDTALDDYARLLRSMKVSRVHVHHLLGVDLDVRALIKRLELPYDVTVHDYFAICPQINLLPWRHGVYCGEPDTDGCNTCIAHCASHGATDIVTWRMQHAWLFRDADRVLCPSLDVMQRLQRYGLADRAEVAPHEAVPLSNWPIRPPRLAKQERLRVAILGTLVPHKGGRSVSAVAALAGGRTLDLHLIGHIDGNFPNEARERMVVTGEYEPEDLPALIASINPHVIWFPMSWPETYSYTLTAAIDAGVAIAAPDIGAFPERLAGRPLTWLADFAVSAPGWVKIFGSIADTLRGKRPPAVRRPAIDDFYATQYLRPSPNRGRGGRKPLMVIVPERFDIGSPTPCGFIRLIQPLSHPDIAGDFDAALADSETALTLDADIIVTQRYAIPDIASAERLARHARNIGAKLIYDLDDDLLNVPKNHPDAAELRPLAKTVRRMLTLADRVWVSTPALAESLRAIRPDADVLENRLDDRIWAATPPAAPVRESPVRILAMGTTSHANDFELIFPALERLRREYDERVVIDILGMTNRTDLPKGLVRIGPPRHAMGSYPTFVHWLTSVDQPWHIGLAPLLDTPFNAGKSPIKTMDYAGLGVAILASDNPVYHGSIADGPAGRLVANTPEAWYAALDALVRDAETRKRMMQASQDAFAERASLARYAAVRRDALHRAWQTATQITVSAA